MANDIKRISVNKFESALPSDNIITMTLDDTDDVVMQVKRVLPLQDMLSFVREVVESCIDAETGEYLPEAYDFAIRVGVLTRYANFTMPSKLDKQYMLIYGTCAFEQVMGLIDGAQFRDIMRAIDKKIKYMLDVMSASAVAKINEVINKFGDIAEAAEKAFAGANPDDIKKVIQGASKLDNVEGEDLAQIILKATDKADEGITPIVEEPFVVKKDG